MDDPLLVSVLHGLANRHEKLQALFRSQLHLVAKLVQRQAVNQFHHEERLAVRGQSGVEHPGDVRVIHHRQRLAFLLKALQNGSRVHARLDELERDSSLHRLGLFGHPDLTHAAFADFFLQRVATRDEDIRSGLGVKDCGDRRWGSIAIGSRSMQEAGFRLRWF